MYNPFQLIRAAARSGCMQAVPALLNLGKRVFPKKGGHSVLMGTVEGNDLAASRCPPQLQTGTTIMFQLFWHEAERDGERARVWTIRRMEPSSFLLLFPHGAQCCLHMACT